MADFYVRIDPLKKKSAFQWHWATRLQKQVAFLVFEVGNQMTDALKEPQILLV